MTLFRSADHECRECRCGIRADNPLYHEPYCAILVKGIPDTGIRDDCALPVVKKEG